MQSERIPQGVVIALGRYKGVFRVLIGLILIHGDGEGRGLDLDVHIHPVPVALDVDALVVGEPVNVKFQLCEPQGLQPFPLLTRMPLLQQSMKRAGGSGL